MRKKVFVSPRILNPFVEELFSSRKGPAAFGDLDVVFAGRLDEGARLVALADVEAFFGIPTAEELRIARRLEVIALPGSGTETIDVEEATARGIAVVNAAGAQYKAVAEHAIGLMLALAKRIALSDRWFHTEKRHPARSRYVGTGWPHGYPVELEGKTLGVVGLGFVGRDLAEKCRLAFGMRVLAYDPYQDAVEAARQRVELRSELVAMLSECDFVSLHLPLGDETRGMFGERELRAMKPSAYLLNLSRGGIVDQQALLRALDEGWIAGAGLDVFDPEPLPDGHPLCSRDDVVLSPHIGGWTAEALPRLARLAAEEMVTVLRGVRSHRLVNPEVWAAFLARRASAELPSTGKGPSSPGRRSQRRAASRRS